MKPHFAYSGRCRNFDWHQISPTLVRDALLVSVGVQHGHFQPLPEARASAAPDMPRLR
ncbi:MAG: hypothetical protein ACLR7Z_16255 [Bilophila wadsworthia]